MEIFSEKPEEFDNGSYPAMVTFRQMQVRPVLEQEHQQRVNVSPEPSGPDAFLVGEVRFDRFPFGDSHENVRKIDSRVDGKLESVNSYHDFGSQSSVPDLGVWAKAKDGVVKAVRHRHLRVEGIMWHPERFAPDFRDADIDRFRRFFGMSEG